MSGTQQEFNSVQKVTKGVEKPSVMRKVRGFSVQQHKNLSLCHITCVCVMFLDNPQVVVVLMQIGGNLGRGQKWGR